VMIFLITFRNTLFHDDLSNEPKYSQIHLTGQFNF